MKKQTTGYNGNENLPKAGTKYVLTMEQLEEYEKCMKSPVYFAQKYFKIVTVDDGLQPMKLYDFQKEAAEAYLDTNKLILATSRQIGKTTIATVIALHYVMFNEWKTVFILGNKESTAVEVLERIQLAYEYLPSWLKVGVEEWNKTSVVFENGSKIRSAATSSDGIRGKSCVTGDMQVNVEIQHKSGNKEYRKLTIKELYELEIELKDRARFKIFSKDKFEHYDQVIYMGIKPIWCIHVNLSEEPIRCTGDHKFLMADGITWKEAKDLKKNDVLYVGIVTSARKQYTYNHKEVIEDVYDVVNISNGNMFMTNGIITHNCNLLYLDECLTYDHKIKLQDKKTLEEKIVNIGELYDILMEEIENVKLNDKYNIFNLEYYYQDSVWYDFQGIKKTTTNHSVKLYLDDGSIIQGTLNHKVYKKNYIPMILDDFEEGFEFSAGIYVTKKEYCYDEVEVYDILNVNNKDHSYSIITNDGFIKSSNCAFIDNWNEFSASVLPVLSSGKKTKLIMTSTPKGLNHFYEYYIGAKNGTNGFKLIEVKWNDVPGRDEAWRQETLETLNGDEIRFRQEYCVTGDTKVEILVEELNKTFVVPIEKLKSNSGVVYKITRNDDLSYIGITTSFKNRLSYHKKSDRFSIGIKSYEILFEGPYDICDLLEEHFIELHDTYKNGLNVTFNGKGKSETHKFNTLGFKFSEESKKKMSESGKNRIKNAREGNGQHVVFLQKNSKETVAKMAKTKKGKPFSIKVQLEDRIKIRDDFNYWLHTVWPTLPVTIVIDFISKKSKVDYNEGKIKFAKEASLAKAGGLLRPWCVYYELNKSNLPSNLTKSGCINIIRGKFVC